MLSSQATFALPRPSSPSAPPTRSTINHKVVMRLALGRLNKIDGRSVFWPKDAFREIKYRNNLDDASKYTLVRGEFRDLMA
ncbi:hypothetical protein IAR50_000911 [Cryptococcus sp. DSM 104548]